MSLKTAAHDIRFMKELFLSAETIARELGDPEPGPEHLVLASLQLPDGFAAQVFDELDVTSDKFATAIRQVHTDSLAAIGIIEPALSAAPTPKAGPFRATGSLNEVFARARELAKKRELRSTDVLVAAAERDHGTVARTFAALDLDRASVIARVAQL